MKIATLAFIFKENSILLGRKRGKPEIGEGTLNGPGGKREEIDKTLLDCVLRETQEEFELTLDASKVEKCAIITFYNNGVADFKVHIYRTSYFEGEPHETKSMVDITWYPTDAIPYERMLESDRTWFPKVIAGEKFCAKVYYKERAKDFDRIEFSPFVDEEE